jgi:hypothetical protein
MSAITADAPHAAATWSALRSSAPRGIGYWTTIEPFMLVPCTVQ